VAFHGAFAHQQSAPISRFGAPCPREVGALMLLGRQFDARLFTVRAHLLRVAFSSRRAQSAKPLARMAEMPRMRPAAGRRHQHRDSCAAATHRGIAVPAPNGSMAAAPVGHRYQRNTKLFQSSTSLYTGSGASHGTIGDSQ
jgi:hypothetical protein